MSGPGRSLVPHVDPFEHDDAAYVLGALDSAGRAAFEAHLLECGECAAQVAALRPAADALVSGGEAVRDALAASLEPAPTAQPDRISGLVRLVERRRRRARWAFGGLAAVAAAAVAALTIAWAAPSAGPASPAAAQQMTATGAAAIRATAAIAPMPWGSEITIDCSYIGTSSYASSDVYVLNVVDQSGRSHAIGSWTLAQSAEARFTSGTALSPGQIRAVDVARSDGTVVLRLAR